MKKVISLLVLALTMLSMTSVFASDVYVDGHYKKDGTYVEGHHRTSPDDRKDNNYNYPGNTNPYK